MSRASIAVPVRVGVAVGLVLVVGGLTGHRDVAGLAALGALVSAFCRADPYRVRAGRLAALVVGSVVSIGIGALIGVLDAPTGVEIVTISILGALAALLVGMLHITGPGAVVFVFAATAAASFAHAPADLWRAMAATAIGAVCGAVASLAPWLLDVVTRRSEITEPRASASPRATTPVRYESIATTLRRRPRPGLVTNSLRIAVAGIASGAVASLIGFSHPMWAAMGAIATMQGVAYPVTVHRGIQRLLGNIVGAVIAAVLLGLGLNYWGAVVAIVICQVIAEYMATVNYAITSSVVTPMALLLTAMSAGLSADAALDRVGDTAIGVVLGILIAALSVSHHYDPASGFHGRHTAETP